MPFARLAGYLRYKCEMVGIDFVEHEESYMSKFDNWLHEKHGNYEDSGKSMDDLIREKYGEKGVKLINELI